VIFGLETPCLLVASPLGEKNEGVKERKANVNSPTCLRELTNIPVFYTHTHT